ncbi:hypothetical protein E4U13_001086 [Claviceps humidiphila]|uniref:Secreted protein n=1 Tax=Claviceps humidiphila TaxID=1294629 RepID=A0A9P7U1J9_9HYPO|nr:hypothetical protein E4U13_001086 [Claviceps humidiphila]
MVQITSLMVAVIVAITPVAQAGPWACHPGLDYCGSTLLHFGYDAAKLFRVADAAGLHSLDYKGSGLFTCNADGGITYKRFCLHKCLYRGRGKNDLCANWEGKPPKSE